MNINDLKPGDKISTFNDSSFCVRYDVVLDTSTETSWNWDVMYSSSDYVILNLEASDLLYLLGNCKNLEKLE